MSKKEEKKAKKAEKKANKKPMEINVSTAIINSVCAIVCVALVAVSLSISVQKLSENKIAVAEMLSSGTASGEVSGDDSSYVDNSGDVSGDISGDVAGDDVTGDVSGDVAGDASADTGATDSTDAPAGNAQSSTNANASGSKAPSSVADVLNYYNTATKKAVDKKVLFSKERVSVEKSYKAGVALKTFKGLVYQFMGVGEENKYTATVTKEDTVDSYHKFLQASKLTAADVKNATCVDKNGIYTVTIQLKDGSSSVQGGAVKSAGGTALDKCGVSQGEGDKNYWDHKNAQNVYDAIDDVAASANISESYSNAVVTATINSKTGNITSLTVKYDFKYEISNVMGSEGTATGSSTVEMKNFKW
ncbi:MAG: hypothetical protein IJZ88_01040 [Clostridia bacterium]|nr:hypothetical protein [Clostridia bacterium]